METEVTRSDTQTVLNQLKTQLEELLKLFTRYVVPQAYKSVRYVTSKVYRDRIAGTSRVKKDGNSKQTDRIKDLDIDEVQDLSYQYIRDDVPCYIQPENSRDSGIDDKKTMASIKSFIKTKTNLEKAKEKLLEKPESLKWQDRVKELQEKYENEFSEMREKGYKFTIVTNMSKKAYNDKMREYIMQQRTANGEKKIDDILDIENSDIIKEATSEYDKMFIDEALFNEMLQKAKENKGAELTKAEINDIKGQCKYQQITVDTFKEKANAEGIGYTVFQYDKVQADAICKELNSNDDIEEFTCELSADNNDMVDIYIFDKDIENYEYTNGCNFKHISATSIEDSASTVTNSNYDKVEFNQLPFEVPVENVKLAQNVFKNKDYTLSYKTNKNGEKIAVFTINKITLAEAKRMYEEEKSINVVDESVKRCKETDLKDKKKCMSIVRENIKSPSAIIDKLKNEANKGNKDARNLLEINSLLVEANGGKELSEKQWREFNPDRLRVDGEYDNSLINELADKIRKENEKSFTDDTKTDNETSNLADNEVAVLEDIDFGDKE